ncbi:MAG: diacylglycerol kinase family protein [Patescibacteria group bacterium]
MYCYVYDTFLSAKKYESELHQIESRLMDLGISGRIERLTILKSFKEIIEEAVKKGAQTIVAVGNDETISKIISFLPHHDITLGIIPVGPDNTIADMLGIPSGITACSVLSARITQRIDLGKANDAYFISTLKVPAQPEMIMDCGGYHISSLSEKNDISICNFSSEKGVSSSSPQDGLLEAIISAPTSRGGFFKKNRRSFNLESVFPFKKLKIKCSTDCLPIVADGQITIKTPVTVQVVPKKLKVIVGKQRMF